LRKERIMEQQNQNTLDSGRLDRIAEFESRMEVVKKNDEDLHDACRAVHGMLTTAGYVAEALFGPEASIKSEVVLSISAAIADELEDIREAREGGAEDDDESGELA
jgi:hypothetical protein